MCVCVCVCEDNESGDGLLEGLSVGGVYTCTVHVSLYFFFFDFVTSTKGE